MNLLLENRIALITGGNSGIGKQIALTFAQQGAQVVILGLNPETGHSTLHEIEQIAPQRTHAFYAVDVADHHAVGKTIDLILQQFDHLDILVNNAGMTQDQLLIRMSEQQWDQVIAVNLKGYFNTCHFVTRHMLKRRQGNIINISSIVGVTGNQGQTNYAASKAGVIGMTKSLAKEVASRQILVNCIAPGFIETRMTDTLSEKQKETLLSSIPLGRFGKPLDVAHMAVFLASHWSSYITGQVFTVDGGMVMHG